jgi:Flp pilus assembly protein protease CpaA
MEMFAIATLVLVAGMVDDLRSRKVHNHLVIGLFALTVVSTVIFRGFDGSIIGLKALVLSLILTIPLFSARMLGGGDVKLFGVFALAVDPNTMFWTLVFSFVWGAIFGLVRAALQKQLMMLVRNTYRIASRQKFQMQEIHKLPYTFALLMGWFTQLTFLRMAGAL